MKNSKKLTQFGHCTLNHRQSNNSQLFPKSDLFHIPLPSPASSDSKRPMTVQNTTERINLGVSSEKFGAKIPLTNLAALVQRKRLRL